MSLIRVLKLHHLPLGFWDPSCHEPFMPQPNTVLFQERTRRKGNKLFSSLKAGSSLTRPVILILGSQTSCFSMQWVCNSI